MNVFGISFSKEGKDAASANPTDLVWSTEFDSLAIYQQDTVIARYDGESSPSLGPLRTVTTAAHDLNFIPTTLAYIENESGKAYILNGSFGDFTADDNNFYVKLWDQDSTYPTYKNVYYYLFKDAAESSSTQTPGVNTKRVGIKMMKEGKDISSIFIEDQVFSSDYPPLKLYDAGITSDIIVAAGATTITSISHDLPFVPAFVVIDNDTGAILANSLAAGDYGDDIIQTYTTSTSLNIKVTNPSGSSRNYGKYRYLIFGDKAIE